MNKEALVEKWRQADGRPAEIKTTEVLCQCWECCEAQLRYLTTAKVENIRCNFCKGPVEVLTIDDAPQP